MTKKQKNQNEARAYLAERLPPGSTVYTNVTHVARSGMSRRIRVLIIRNGEPVDVSLWVGVLLGYRRGKDGGLVVGGCGMDMGYHVVSSLSYALHGSETVGPDAIAAAAQGRWFQPTAQQFRAGYSLIQRPL